MKTNYKFSFYLFATFLLLSMSLFTGSSLATLEELEPPTLPPPKLEEPEFQGSKVPDTGQSIPAPPLPNVYIIWTQGLQGNTKLFFKKSTDGGNNFGPATTVSSPNSDIHHSSIVIDSSKNIYVAWTEGPYISKEVYIKKSTNGGNSFGQAINLSNTPGNPTSSRMAIDSKNNIYVAWVESQTIYLRKSTNGGNSFGAVTTINAPAVEGAHLAVYQNNTYVTWRTETQNDEIYLKKSTNGGNSFGPAINVSNTPADSYNHHLAVSGNNIYVTWREETQTGLKLLIKKSSNGGNSFGPANIIWESPSDSDSVLSRIALGSGSKIYAVWSDINFANIVNPDKVIFFKKSINSGNVFTPSYPKIIYSGPGNPSFEPIITVR